MGGFSGGGSNERGNRPYERSGMNYESSGNRYPGEREEYTRQRDYGRYDREQDQSWSDEEKGRQFGSSWRSGNTQRESGNRDWVSGVGQGDYRENREGYREGYNDGEYNRGRGNGETAYRGQQSQYGSQGRQSSMGGGTWGSEGGGGWEGSQQMRRQSFAGRGPQGYRRSDERISEDINEELTTDDELDASGISVEVKNGEVLLKGSVTDRQSKRRAEEIAESCSGVKDVQNQIRVKREDSSQSEHENRGEKSDKTEDKRTRLAS